MTPPSPYYQDDAVTIYHGDCLDVLPALTDVGVVITSPPYNLGRGLDDRPAEAMHDRASKSRSSRRHRLTGGYDEHEDALPLDEYREWQHQVLTACWHTLRDDGAIFYNHKPRVQAGRLLLPTEFVPPSVRLRQVIVWDRGMGLSFVPGAYASAHELILLMAKPGFALKSRSHSAAGDLWRFRPETADHGHPCPFPIGLPARVLDTAQVNGPVLDPFMGSGTTLRAAKDAGLQAIGIELSERYCETAVKRLAQEVLAL
jgi:site-specific DNA-methyltransferase (adenine-specific)